MWLLLLLLVVVVVASSFLLFSLVLFLFCFCVLLGGQLCFVFYAWLFVLFVVVCNRTYWPW